LNGVGFLEAKNQNLLPCFSETDLLAENEGTVSLTHTNPIFFITKRI
jgi:hypothetical protein